MVLFIPLPTASKTAHVVQSLSHVRLCATPGTAACQASLCFTISWSLLKLMSIESVMPSSHLILCHSFHLLPSLFPSIRVFSNEISGLISFRIDWFDLLAVQRTPKSLLQHHSSKASFFGAPFFMVQLSHPYMTTGKTIGLTRPLLAK